MTLGGAGKGRDQERTHPGGGYREVAFLRRWMENGGMEIPRGFSGQRETHGPVHVEISLTAQKKEGIQSIGRKGKKINGN